MVHGLDDDKDVGLGLDDVEDVGLGLDYAIGIGLGLDDFGDVGLGLDDVVDVSEVEDTSGGKDGLLKDGVAGDFSSMSS